MKSKLFLIGLITILCLIGCGNNSAIQTSISSDLNNNSDLYTTMTLIDGIKYQIPKSWENKEYKESNGLGHNVGIGYYLEMSGNIKEGTSGSGMVGVDTGNVVEGIELYVSKQDLLESMTLSETLDYLKEYLASENVEYEDVSIGKLKGIKSNQDDKTTTYVFPLNNSMLFGYSVISDKSKLTSHTEEIEYVINSITIDTSLSE